MKVNNINGTSGKTCSCDSWLDHWEKFSGQSLSFCVVENCNQKDLVGAHIQKDNANDRNWYIIPLCKAHNGETGGSLAIGDYVNLVSANTSETCGKLFRYN
jgi:hypothetical protein